MEISEWKARVDHRVLARIDASQDLSVLVLRQVTPRGHLLVINDSALGIPMQAMAASRVQLVEDLGPAYPEMLAPDPAAEDETQLRGPGLKESDAGFMAPPKGKK